METERILYADAGYDTKFALVITDDADTPINLSTATIKSQMKQHFSSEIAIDIDINVIDAVNGSIELIVPSTAKSGRYVFDAYYEISNVKTKFLKGMMVVKPSVTT